MGYKFLNLLTKAQYAEVTECFDGIKSVEDFTKVVFGLNPHLPPKPFHGLIAALELSKKNSINPGKEFFSQTLPDIVAWAQVTPDAFQSQLPILNAVGFLNLSCYQATALLANMFLCLLPPDPKLELPPVTNFVHMFQHRGPKEVAKLQMFLHFFERIGDRIPEGHIAVRRVQVNPKDCSEKNVQANAKLLRPIQVEKTGKIGDETTGYLQVCFSGEHVGGDVLSGGAGQEELMFATHPLATISLLLCTKLRANEAFRISGAEQYSYVRYNGLSVEYGGDFQDTAVRTQDGDLLTSFVMIDAQTFKDYKDQTKPKSMLREFTKALAGFSPHPEAIECPIGTYPKLATGNWGCGSQGGDVYLKSIIQWMAASDAEREMMYYTFNEVDDEFSFGLEELSEELCGKYVTVGQMWNCLKIFHKSRDFDKTKGSELFRFLKAHYKIQ